MKKVVVYGVYHKEENVEKFMEEIEAEVHKNNNLSLVMVYIDDTKLERLSFERMLNEIVDNDINVILMEDMVNAVEKIKNSRIIIKYLKKLNIEVIFLNYKISMMTREEDIRFEFINIINDVIKKGKKKKDIIESRYRI